MSSRSECQILNNVASISSFMNLLYRTLKSTGQCSPLLKPELVLQCCPNKVLKLGGLNSRNVLPHNSGGEEWESKMSAELLLPESCERESFHASHLTSCGLLDKFCPFWFVETLSGSLPSSSYGVLPMCMPVSKFPPFYKTINHSPLRAHPTPV